MANPSLKYIYGILVVISISIGGLFISFEISKDSSSLYRDGELLAKEKWILNGVVQDDGRESGIKIKEVNLTSQYKVTKYIPFYKGTKIGARLYEYFYFDKETKSEEFFPSLYYVQFSPIN